MIWRHISAVACFGQGVILLAYAWVTPGDQMTAIGVATVLFMLPILITSKS